MNDVEEEAIYKEIYVLIKNAKENVKTAINLSMVYAYYEIGKRIFVEEQKGKERAGYGELIIKNCQKNYLLSLAMDFLMKT